MQYNLEEINGAIGINDTALVSNRCYIKSPFENEDAIYYGGFDPNSNTSTNMAWIFKKYYQTNAADNPYEQEIRLTIYPIPVVNVLNVEINTNESIQYEIISILGKTLLSDRVGSGTHNIDISELPSNIYFLRIGNLSAKFLKTE